MRCPKCQAENREGRRFCSKCAAPLAVVCASCGFTNDPGDEFCGGCAQSLRAGKPMPGKFQSPESYTPKHLAEKILTSKSALEGERKQVTVLFADMKGSMELLADRDPEEARKLLDPVIEHMMEAVHRYEGTVSNLMGDGIMALFGAPVAHEDHAVRACYAALRMQESVQRYAEEVRRTEGVPIQIRAGLHSGEVVVGSIGNDLKMDYTAIGQTVHLASRMEQMATPGSIMVTHETLRLAEGYVQVKSLGPVHVKGIHESVEAHEVTGAGPVRSRLQAAAARGFTRFVGRAAEFETLCRALDQARQGHGQIAALVGEPGVGKSRLFWELAHSWRTNDWLILASGSVSYGKATAHLAVIDLLKSYFAIEERDDVRRIREKVTGKLLALDKSLEPALPAFLTLFDVAAEDPLWESLDPSQRRQRTFDAVKRLLIRESQVQPVVVVFEDLHWIDSESQTILDSLVEGLPGVRILLLVNYRPEYQHGWGSKSYYSQLRIDPLPPESAGELIQALLGNDESLAALKRLLIERTEGNPFFLEESIRTLVETKGLSGERGSYRAAQPLERVQVPATVQAVLAARIDRLPADEKRLLQSAAVVGKDVPYVLLQAVTDPSEEEIRRGLSRLQSAEFLYETSLFPEVEYTFKHALTHEVAYGSLLQERRRALHGRIVEAIERRYSNRLNEQIERLAHHAQRGELWEKAVEYFHQAGKKAARRSANQEAIDYFKLGLEGLSQLPEIRESLEKAINIRVDLGPVLTAAWGFGAPQVEENLNHARVLCERFGETPQLFPVLWGLARMHDTRGELRAGRQLGERLLAFAQSAQDSALLLEAHHEAWANLVMLGELSSAWSHIEQGFALYDARQHRHHALLYGGHDPGVCCRYHAAEVLWLRGYPHQALRRSEDSLALARQLSHASTLASALSFAAWLQARVGARDAVQARLAETMSLATEGGFSYRRTQANLLQAWLLLEQGQRDSGMAQTREFLSARRTSGIAGRWYMLFIAMIADASRQTGGSSEVFDAVNDALVQAQLSGECFYEAELHRVKGELLLIQTSTDEREAEACFQKAMQLARGQGAKSLELRATMSLSRLWQRQGKSEEARKLLREIYGWFTEGFDTADLKEARLLLEKLG
jgi:predicted ATPase/class 3 adenylate cyclase